MIKAEDLRIGDLVRVRKMKFFSFIIPEDVAYKVTQIISKDSLINNRSSVCLCLTNPKQNQTEYPMPCGSLLPIPLTPKILEKNGWKRDKLVPYIYGHEAHNIEVICTPNSEWVNVTFKGDTLHRIKYVHELQHILWALGMDANLKI